MNEDVTPEERYQRVLRGIASVPGMWQDLARQALTCGAAMRQGDCPRATATDPWMLKQGCAVCGMEPYRP